MKIFLIVLLLIVGIILIVKGGDVFVDASSWIAKVSGIPKLIVGATIVSIATTLPELLVSIFAAVQGKVDMAIGNAVGSVTFNTAVIMAISILFLPATVKRKDYFLKSMLFLLAAGLVVMCGFIGKVNIIMSIALIVLFVIFMIDNVLQARKAVQAKFEDDKEEKKELEVKQKYKPTKKEIIVNILKFILGASAIVFGADLLVDNASELAKIAGISERIISITILAVGTSLPELVTTITALVKKQSDLSVGNIIGANILDLTLIMPMCSIISGKSLLIASQKGLIDLIVCSVVGMIVVLPMLFTKKFKRWQGAVLLTFYLLYIILICFVL